MAAAGLAPLPVAPLVLVVLADLVFSLGHLDRLGLPERECVDRAGGPAPTGGAVAVASALRIARDDNRDSAAEALPFERLFILAHEFFLCSIANTSIARAVYLETARYSRSPAASRASARSWNSRRRVICPFSTLNTITLLAVTSIPSRPRMWAVFGTTTSESTSVKSCISTWTSSKVVQNSPQKVLSPP